MHESEREVAQSCRTLSNPMDYSLPGSVIHGIFQARVYKNLTAKLMVRSDMIQEGLLPKTALKVLPSAMRQEKERKEVKSTKEEMKLVIHK